MVRETIEQFLQLQKFDIRINEINVILANIPEMVKEYKKAFDESVAANEKESSDFEHSKQTKLTVSTNLAENKKLLESAQKKLSSVQNNKEYEAVLKELDSLKKSINDAENKIKTLDNTILKLESSIETLTANRNQKEGEYKSQKEEKEEENKQLFEELAKIKAEREEFIKKMKKSLLSSYEKIRVARNNVTIVAVEDETCTGCYMRIPPQLAVDVKKELSLLQCPHCQRYLFQAKKTEDNEDKK